MAKGLKTKLPKEFDAQAKSHAKYLAQIEANPNAEDQLVQEIALLKAEIERL